MAEADRRTVRQWKQANPKAIYEDIIKWFDQEFHYKISQQTVSTTLSTKYDYLDSDIRND
jgi:phage gp16-like protein